MQFLKKSFLNYEMGWLMIYEFRQRQLCKDIWGNLDNSVLIISQINFRQLI